MENNGISRFFLIHYLAMIVMMQNAIQMLAAGPIVQLFMRSSSDQAERAADLLYYCGAVDVDDKSTEYSSASASRSSESTSRDDDSNRGGVTIPRIQENLEGRQTFRRTWKCKRTQPDCRKASRGSMCAYVKSIYM